MEVCKTNQIYYFIFICLTTNSSVKQSNSWDSIGQGSVHIGDHRKRHIAQE
jgi:hypothetical protein